MAGDYEWNSYISAGTAMATTCGVFSQYLYMPPMGQTKAKPGRYSMTLWKVYVVDIRKAVVTSEHTLIGRDEGDAAIGLKLTEAELKSKAKDELEIIWQDVGTFEKLKRSRVTIEKDED